MLGDGGSRNKKANIYSRRTDGGEKMDRSDRLSPSHLLFLLAISLGPSAVIHLCALKKMGKGHRDRNEMLSNLNFT